MVERSFGHDFLHGFFVIDDDGTHVFEDRDPKRYKELCEIHRQALRPKLEAVESLVRQGMPWESVYDKCGFMSDAWGRPVQLKARIARRWFVSWADPQVVKELSVPDGHFPQDCRYRNECPTAHKDRKGLWGDWSMCDESRGACPRWPEDVRRDR